MEPKGTLRMEPTLRGGFRGGFRGGGETACETALKPIGETTLKPL
jgi:hypothetical protein